MTSTLSQVGELILESRIGVGFTAEVYKGIWTRRGDTVPRRGDVAVALRRGPGTGGGTWRGKSGRNPREKWGNPENCENLGKILEKSWKQLLKILEKSWETSKHLEKWYGRVFKKENSQW